jgi:hypothetical protein
MAAGGPRRKTQRGSPADSDVADRICDLRARTMEGLRVKARALQWRQPAARQSHPDDPSLYDELASSIIADLVPELPPAA